MAKPTTLPEFATTDSTDPTSGINNVTEPVQSFKDFGWNPFRVRPNRSNFNWLHRWTYNWIKYVDEELTEQVNNHRIIIEISVESQTLDFTIKQEFSLYCIRNAHTIGGVQQTDDELVHVSFPNLLATAGNSTAFRLKPATVWPSWFIQTYQEHKVPFIVIDDGDYYSGLARFPDNSTAFLWLERPDSSSVLDKSNFTNSGDKGFPPQTIQLRQKNMT